jgi:hypothetical protein
LSDAGESSRNGQDQGFVAIVRPKASKGDRIVNAHRFDSLTRDLVPHLTRRATVRTGEIGLAAAIGGLGLRSGRSAQARPDFGRDATPAAGEATPAASPAVTNGEKTEFLFVQAFEDGTLVPKPGEEGVFVLTLNSGTDQTVYFSDRPERIVGVVPTARFLAGLNFSLENPPNAALVANTAQGEDVVVLELYNPVYAQAFGDQPTARLSYDVRVLASYQGEGLAHLARQQGDAALAERFGAANLFIDDCSDGHVECLLPSSDWLGQKKTAGVIGPMGFCWHLGDACCQPCTDNDDWLSRCNQEVAACNGKCDAFVIQPCW